MSFETCDKSNFKIETGSLRNTTSGKIEYRFSYTNEEGIEVITLQNSDSRELDG